MDNVPSLAIQLPIVREIPNMLCPTAVFKMSAELVMKLARESKETALHREGLLHKLETLEAGASLCKQYAVRSKNREESTTLAEVKSY